MIKQLNAKFPEFTFIEGDTFIWSPAELRIYYNQSKMQTNKGQLTLLHEVGHAVLKHETYDHDIDLLKYELSAWEKAKELSSEFNVKVDQDFIENNLDSYRDWLKKRSTCPDCSFVNFQTSHSGYDCFNCGCSWRVPVSQICRIQRRKVTI